MKINTLELTNVRGFTYATLKFQPGFNLIVGINGVGKTTVLESLRIVLSHLLSEITISKNRKESFNALDIQLGKDNLQLNANISIEDEDVDFLISKQKEIIKKIDTEDIRAQTYQINDSIYFKQEISKKYKLKKNQPLGIYYSSHRSLMTEEKPSKNQIVGGQAVAFADALNTKREFAIRIFADWLKVQEELSKENPKILKTIEAIKGAIYKFLPGFKNLEVITDERTGLNVFLIEKAGEKLNFYMLSDGERSVLTLVFDISRRLIIANTDIKDPLNGEAVILIDELDLHLHPKWQRTIVSDLSRTFPNCQFIATTHSPQIIGEVKAEAISIIDRDKAEVVYKPEISFGADAQRILEELLDVPIRNEGINEVFEELNKAVDAEKFEHSKEIIEALKKYLGEADPELLRINSMIQFLENDLDDEKDN